MFHQQDRAYDFSRIASERGVQRAYGTFVIRFDAVPAELPCGCALLGSNDDFTLDLTDKALASGAARDFCGRTQNYYSVTASDGTCLVLEARLRLGADPQPWTIGFPLALCGDQKSVHEFAVMFDGVYFSIFADGLLMDREAPFEELEATCGWTSELQAYSSAVRELVVSGDVSAVTWRDVFHDVDIPAAFYTPRGFNTWIGDVVTYAWKGEFHVFYLLDRRHHGSRRGKGAHIFCHIVTRDFMDWTDYGPVFELEESWQSVGTGNAFEYGGKLCLSFGWHTERTRPYEKRANFLFERNLRELGHTGEIRYDELGDITPGGGSYAFSEDGIHFRKADILMHTLENPSIFVQPDGKLHLIQDGVWESDHPGCWKLIDKAFPPRGEASFARNCLDCPCFFTLDGWEYFYVGFSGFWGRPVGTTEWLDFVEKGWDIYDGANVPMTASCGGRMIEGSWPRTLGWGSCLLLREIVPLGNGRLGKKWLEEAMPATGAPLVMTPGRHDLPEEGDIMLGVMLADDVTSLVFEGEGTPFELWVSVAEKRASIGGTPGERLTTFREGLMAHPEIKTHGEIRRVPGLNPTHSGRAFAHDGLIGLKGGGVGRILIHRDRKLGATMIDVELCGCHTLLFGTASLAIRSVSVRLGSAD